MANNVAITSGIGTAIATDDVAGIHYQVVKLAIGTEDSAVRAPGDSTNGLDTDVTRVIPGTTATALGKAEDAAHASGDTGVMALTVRKDTAAALAGTDGDYAPLEVDASGRLHVNVGAQAALPAGTNNIGDVDVLTLPSLPAGTNTIGKTAPAPATSATPTKVTVTTVSTQIVAANASRRMVLVQVVSGGPVYLATGTATTDHFPAATGGVFEHHNTSALTGIVASDSADVRVWEES